MTQRFLLGISLLFIFALLLPGKPCLAQEANDLYWTFLITGEAQPPSSAELLKMQLAHFANFQRLANEKKLLAVGPLQDPNRKLRGIALLKVDNAAQIPELFEPDPYISEKIMGLDVNPIAVMYGELTYHLDPTQLEEYRLVVWDSTGTASEARKPGDPVAGDRDSSNASLALQQHLKYWQEMREAGRCLVYCRFVIDSNHFGVCLCPKVSDDELQSWIQGDPMVKFQQIRAQTMPQFLSKGAVSGQK
jgi:uncharacterized protein YciI